MQKTKMRQSSLITALLMLGAAVVIALLWWQFARAQSARPTADDAVFVRRIEDFIRRG